MKIGNKIYFCLSAVVLLVMLLIEPSHASIFGSNRPKSYVVIDYNTGDILSEKNSQIRMYPASLTKLMTLYVLFDEIANNRIDFNTKLKISATAANQEPTKLGLPAGSYITVKDAILSVIVKSHNDIAYAIAENIAGNEKEFAKLMNKKAREIGLNDTHFVHPNGLHDENQYTTALDMAKLSRVLMVHHNAYYTLFSIPKFNWNNVRYASTNHLLDYQGVDGIKTGYTRASGFNLISSASKENTRIIAVVMGFQSSSSRDDYMKDVLDLGFEIAAINRKNAIAYLSKPSSFGSSPSDNIVIENATPTDASIDNKNTYTIDKIPYIEKITTTPKVVIRPSVKYSSRGYGNRAKGKYIVQIGAFSNYSSALRVTYNAVKTKKLSRYLTKQDIVISKKSNFYLARFSKLTKDEAFSTCKILKSKGEACFILTA